MSQNLIQTSFSGGELAPSMFARVDIAKYHSGAARMRNFFVDYRSGASSRPGTRFIAQTQGGAQTVRLIPFTYSVFTAYVLEFGNNYIRFINNGGLVLEAPFNITNIQQTLPAVVTVPGHNFTVGNTVFISNTLGMTQINGRYYLITAIAGNNISLADQNSAPIDARAFGAYAGGGTVARVYSIPSPYLSGELNTLKFTQSPTTMTLTHPNHPPYDLTIISATNWTLLPIQFGELVDPPTGLSGTPSAAGTASYAYVVTAVDRNGRESAPSAPVPVINAANFTLTPLTIQVDWITAPGAAFYNVYKAEMNLAGPVPAGVAFGFVGSASNTSFIDSNIAPDFSTSPPIPTNPFVGNNPSDATYFQQRRAFFASDANPETFWLSQPGTFTNFNVSNPVQPDDAITGTLVSNQVNAIKSAISMPGGLIILTAKGAWQVTGGGGGVGSTTPVTATDATAVPQAFNGASDVPPIVVNFDILYIQAKGAIVRDLSYNLYAQIYTGTDISVMANHLFTNFQITQWAYAEEPFKIIWAIRDDGALLSLTFLKEQEIVGWAHHDTRGTFQSVASVTEGQVDAVYVVVKRFIKGQYVQYIERFAERTDFTYGPEDAWCVDCGVQSVLPTPSANLFPQAASGNGVVFLSDSNIFNSSAIGQVIRAGGGIATVVSVPQPNAVIVNITRPITAVTPNDPNNLPFPVLLGDWTMAKPTSTFTGLDFLEGQQVSVIADGGVVAPKTVVNGTITLAQPATKVTVGLGFQAQLQTMPLDTGEPTIQGKRKKIAALTVRAANTRGLKAGSTFRSLVAIKEFNNSVPLSSPINLVTGDERVIMDPSWNVPGQICLQLDDPLPATVLGVIPEIVVGDTPK